MRLDDCGRPVTLEQDLILTFAAHGLHLDLETVENGNTRVIRAHPIKDDVAAIEREIREGRP